MKPWMKVGIGLLAVGFLFSVFVNLSVIGVFPALPFIEKDTPDNGTTVGKPTTPPSDLQHAFVGSKEEAYFMCVFRKDAFYWEGVYKGFQDAGEQLGVRTVFEGCNEYDANAQLQVFEQIIAKKPKGIALSPISPDIFKEPIARAVAAGIKVTCFASDSPDSMRSTLITSNNIEEGHAAGEYIANYLHGSGEIGIIERPNQSNHAKRVESLIAYLSENYPRIRVVERVTADGDEAKAARLTKNMIEEHPDVQFIFCVAGIEGRGAAAGVKEMEKDVKIFCIDADPPIIEMLKTGEILVALQPNTINQGYWSLLTLYIESNQLIDPISDWKTRGVSPMPRMIDNGFDFVTKENGDDFYYRKQP